MDNRTYEKPIRVYLEDTGYNYICGFGKLLFDKWFKSATPFGEDGFAFVETFEKVKLKIDTKGRVYCS